MASPKKNPNLKIASGTFICADSELIGPITIGPRTIIHPRVKIIAEAGPITIGEGNLIEEQSIICNRRRPGDSQEAGERMMSIGDNNVFESSSTCEALKIGDNNVLEPKCYVGPSVELTNGCIVGAGCRLVDREAVVENTVIYGSDHLRRIQTERPAPQTLQLDFLTKILPNYHHLLRSTKPKI